MCRLSALRLLLSPRQPHGNASLYAATPLTTSGHTSPTSPPLNIHEGGRLTTWRHSQRLLHMKPQEMCVCVRERVECTCKC